MARNAETCVVASSSKVDLILFKSRSPGVRWEEGQFFTKGEKISKTSKILSLNKKNPIGQKS